MQLISNGTQGPTTPPAKQTPVGTPGYGYGGPPGSTPATDVDPDIFNTVLGELVGIATATGNVLDPTNNAQAIGAIKTLAGANATGVSVAGTTTLTASQAGIIEVNATAGNIQIDLPAPNVTGTVFRFEFRRGDDTANTVTVQTPSGLIVNANSSAASITLPGFSFTRLICDGSSYVQDGPYPPSIGLNSQAFTASGTFTVPAGVTAVEVEVWGGGSGSAAGYSASSLASGGGGGGGYARSIISGLTGGGTVAVTVGAGGAPGTTSVLPTAGGSSSFGSYCSATGGVVNGVLTLSNPTAISGPGEGAGGNLNIPGCWGSPPVASTAGSAAIGGNGGAAAMGGGGGGGNAGVGTAGSFPGGGGGGVGATITNGMAGAPGLVLVRW